MMLQPPAQFPLEFGDVADPSLVTTRAGVPVVVEFAAAALPSGKFSANAAWFQLKVLTYNLLAALTRFTLPGVFLRPRAKRLRFLRFNTVREVVHHAQRTLSGLAGAVQLALGLMRLTQSKK